MTKDEARAYFIDNNERIISVAKDENIYNYETQQIEDVFMRRTFEANELAIKALEQEPKTGHWITKDGKEQGYDIGGIKTWYIQIMCDKCGFIKTAIEGHTGQYKFCPNCGAKMQEVKDNG